MRKIESLDWVVGFKADKSKDCEKYVSAQVPGNANLDWARAEKMPDWKRDTNFREYAWMENVFWVYKAHLPSCELLNGEKRQLVGKGIDYEYEIYFNGTLLYYYEGMFAPFCIDLGKDEGQLEIVIYPAPKDKAGHKNTREEAAQCCKPAVSYEWDWHPRLIPVGIWDELYIETVSETFIESANITYTLTGDLKNAQIECKAVYSGRLLLSLYKPCGEVVFENSESLQAKVSDIELWWCNGYGEASLYTWRLDCYSNDKLADSITGKIGFRKIELLMNEGAWNEPREFPKGRSVAPITLSLNNVPIFAKGTNWVNPKVFTGTITKQTYEQQIMLAKGANFNIFRSWGGAIVNKDSFFELCDEHGIMVWQEFMLACNNYRDNEKYLAVLESEAIAIINRLKKYACVVMWCGGNELFNDWSGMTDQSLALRLLNKLCYEHDWQKRPYLMTSPLYGMAHGCYLFTYPDKREVFEVMPKAKQTAYTEFGVPSISNYECCLMATDESNVFPLLPSDITKAHHAFDAWNAPSYAWSELDTIRHYFNEPTDIHDMIEKSQWLQGEGYKCIYEEARRQKPYCSMAINWCWCEPWPTLANNSIINYPASAKSSYAEVALACRGVLASAQLPHFSWRAGEQFSAALWMLNDTREEILQGSVTVKLLLNNIEYTLLTWNYPRIEANKNLAGPIVRFELPATAKSARSVKALGMSPESKTGNDYMPLVLKLCAGEYSSEYKLVFYE